jgi:DNA processing protein
MFRNSSWIRLGELDVVFESRCEPWLRLLLVPELKKVHWFRLHREMGSPEAILGAAASQICEIAQVSEETARAILRGPDSETIEREKQLIEQTRAALCTFDDARYPENLRHCSGPPMLLFLLGEMRPDDRYAVVVVGSRSMTQYGKLTCQRLVAELVGAGMTVVSGMAYGIDSIAHETALRHGGRTLAVLAQGLAARESSQRMEMRQRIAERGAVISEFPMTANAERYHFPTRNHTMAALGLATVVVEAQEKSGALITADKAVEENRQVFAVPGDVTRQTSRGTNALIRAGAILARDGQDILDDLRPQLGALLTEHRAETAPAGDVVADGNLSDTARAVLARVRHEPVHFDLLHEELAESGVGFGSLSTALLELEMKGLVRHLPGNLYTVGSTR